MTELESIFSNGRKIKIGEREVLIKTVELGDIPRVIGVMTKFAHLFDEKKKNNSNNANEIGQLLSTSWPEILDLFKITTDLSDDEIKKLNLGATAVIIKEVVMDHSDFLRQTVLPVFKEIRMNVAKDGLDKSKSL